MNLKSCFMVCVLILAGCTNSNSSVKTNDESTTIAAAVTENEKKEKLSIEWD